ncbi:MAG: hypothetical protein HLX50_09080 [Alteromonadaceae bacterium]|nr:hypothetical protein [Alteromonadaceae bacterium]
MSTEQVAESRKPIVPTSVVGTWVINDTTYTLTDTGSGQLSGDGTGTVEYASGKVRARPNPAPAPEDGGIEWTFDRWDGGAKQTQAQTPNESGATTFSLLSAPVAPGSVQISIKKSNTKQYTVVILDDGAGNLVLNGQTVGSVDYSTGAVTVSDIRGTFTSTNQTTKFL